MDIRGLSPGQLSPRPASPTRACGVMACSVWPPIPPEPGVPPCTRGRPAPLPTLSQACLIPAPPALWLRTLGCGERVQARECTCVHMRLCVCVCLCVHMCTRVLVSVFTCAL